VVGERRLGKSSLLNALTWKETQKEHLGQELQSIIVLLDFQRFHRMKLEEFFCLLSSEIRNSMSTPPGTEGPSGYGLFQDILDSLQENGERLLLFFDEFDAITSNPEFDVDFYSFMRSAANNYPVAYVTSSKDELQKICYSSDIAASPFFNIFSNLYLRPFNRREAHELITVPSLRAGIPLASYEREILKMAGLFPFYLQIACSAYFELFQEQDSVEVDRNDLKERFLEEAGPHFQYFWEHLDPERRYVIKQLQSGIQPGPEFQHVCKQMTRGGYLLTDGTRFRLFSSVFAEYLRTLDSSPSGFGPDQKSPLIGFSALGPGQSINQYRILGRAGEGGMGVVYKAEDESLQRYVALKLCHPTLASTDAVRRRLRREAVAAASLDHPYITSIHEMFEHSGQLTLVLEWIEGTTLKDLLRERGPLEWRQVAHWMIEACQGLHTAHDKQIIHRDIKSSNLMITTEGHVKITDFGLAKCVQLEAGAITELTGEGDILGTVAYMSPEQAQGQPSDHRSDLFSLGVVMFECLTGKVPFQRDSAAAMLHAVTYEPAPYLGLYPISNAERLDTVVRRLLEKSPDDRYQSAAEVEKDLKDLFKKRKRNFLSWIAPSGDVEW
jgi:serine/threonine-protein kinase